MSTDNNKSKRRLTFYHFLLWLLVGMQFSAHVLNHITPGDDRTGVSLVNAWIGIGTFFSDNWSAFTIITILGCVGVYLYKHLMNEKFTLQDALPYLAAVLANIFFFLKAWDVNAWTEKWKAINSAPISFIVWTLITVGITVAVHAFIKSRQAYAEFEKQVLPSLDESSEADTTREQSQAEIAFRLKHPIIHQIRMNGLHKEKLKKKKEEVDLQRSEFRKRRDEQAIQIAQVHLETNRKINEIIQQKRIEKAENVNINDFGEFDKESKKMLSLEPEKNRRNFIRNLFEIGITLLLTFLVLFVFIFWGTKNTDKIKEYIELLGEIHQATEGLEPVVNELLYNISIPVSVAVLIMVIFALCYILVKFCTHTAEQYKADNKKIKNIVTLVKAFVIGTIYAIMRPLLFIPDFFEVLEEFLLETDLQKIIDEYNGKDDSDDNQI